MKNLSEEKILNYLRAVSSKTGLTVNDLRVVLALERIIARIETVPELASSLIFKGGFLIFKAVDTTRYTRDVDALAQGISSEKLPKLIRFALNKNLFDCLWFLDVQEAPLPTQGPYGGLQFSIAFQISSKVPSERQIRKLSRIHFDIGFGDSILSPKQPSPMPSLMPEMDPVSWLVYPLESVFAEKLEALLRRGSANSRAKDVYDLVLLFDRCQNSATLKKAIEITFANRNTPIPASFATTARGFDTHSLEKAWGSVYLVGPKKPFTELREELFQRLEKLDQFITN